MTPVQFDTNKLSLDMSYIAKQIPFNKVETCLVKKGKRKNDDIGVFTPKDFDVKIVPTTQSTGLGINVTFGSSTFLDFEFIVFYAMKNILYFKLTNEYDPTSTYKITRNVHHDSGVIHLCTKVAGDGYERLKPFEGEHKMIRYASELSSVVYFITKPYYII